MGKTLAATMLSRLRDQLVRHPDSNSVHKDSHILLFRLLCICKNIEKIPASRAKRIVTLSPQYYSLTTIRNTCSVLRTNRVNTSLIAITQVIKTQRPRVIPIHQIINARRTLDNFLIRLSNILLKRDTRTTA